MRYAFDIDDTLWKLVEDHHPRLHGVGAICACGLPVKQEIDNEMESLMRSLQAIETNEVFIWSAGGIDYATHFLKRHFPDLIGRVFVLPKEKGHRIDVCFDDQEVDLGKINMRVKRPHADHWEGDL